MTAADAGIEAQGILAVPDFEAGRYGPDDRAFIRAARSVALRLKAELALLASEDCADALSLADRQYLSPTLPDWDLEQRFAVLARSLRLWPARHVLMPDTVRGSDLGRRLAAAEACGVASAVIAIEADDAVTLCGERAFERRQARPYVMLLDKEFDCDDVEPPAESRVFRLADTDCARWLDDRGPLRTGACAAALEDAEFVIAGGAGIDDWDAYHALVEAMGATAGGSRVVCDRGLMSRSRQVGSSGHLTTARCYLALGISGAVQHLDGIRGCETVLSVNLDPRAPIAARADLAIVGDANAVMRAMLGRLGGRGVGADG